MTEAEQSAHERRGPTDSAGPAGAPPGQAFGSGYLLQREIGVGGMGTVWRGWARARRQPVAIKILHPHLSGDRTVVNRFLREGDVLTRLDHPNLVKVHDLVVEGGRLGLVMDLVEGSDLHARRRRRGTLSPAEAARIGAQAAGALAAAHAMGVVHLDLKPANILISEQHSPHRVPEPDVATEADLPIATDAASAMPAPSAAPADETNGADQTAETGEIDKTRETSEADIPDADGPVEARLTDFGIARIVDGADQTTTAVTFGTPDYMAPETALDGAATPASDLYALGITLYELVVGRTPYAGGPALTVLARHLERSPRRLPTIPDPLWDVIAACTARNPADRPDAARTAAMLTAAEPALAGIPAAEPLPAGSDYRATSEVRLAGAVAAAIASDALALDPTAAAFAVPAPAAAVQAAEGVAAAVTAPTPAAAIPAAEGAAAHPAPAVPANEGTSAAAFAAPATALAIPAADSESRSATEPVAPTSLPHAAAASTIPKAAQSTQSPQPVQSGQLAQSAHSAPALSTSDHTVLPAAEPPASNQAAELSATHPAPPAIPEPAADFGTAYYAEAAALKPPPKGPFPTASPAPSSRHSRFSGRKTADSRSSRRTERGPLMSRRTKRRIALICGPLLLLGVVGGLLVTSGAFASLHENQHNASEQLPAAAASSRSGPGSGTADHSHAPVGTSASASPSVQSSASASDGSGTTLSGSGAGATGSGASGAAGSGSGTSGGSGDSGSSGSSGGAAAAPAPAPPAAVDTGWACRSGGWKDDGALSVDPCIDYDNGTLYLRGSVKGSYGSSVVIALRVDYGGTYSRTYYSSAFVPDSSGTKTQTVTVGSWPSGQDITCEENVDPASDESDYEYGANSADITT